MQSGNLIDALGDLTWVKMCYFTFGCRNRHAQRVPLMWVVVSHTTQLGSQTNLMMSFHLYRYGAHVLLDLIHVCIALMQHCAIKLPLQVWAAFAVLLIETLIVLPMEISWT